MKNTQKEKGGKFSGPLGIVPRRTSPAFFIPSCSLPPLSLLLNSFPSFAILLVPLLYLPQLLCRDLHGAKDPPSQSVFQLLVFVLLQSNHPMKMSTQLASNLLAKCPSSAQEVNVSQHCTCHIKFGAKLSKEASLSVVRECQQRVSKG